MHDAERLARVAGRFVRRVQTVEHARDHGADDRGGIGASRGSMSRTSRGERLPVHVLHDEQELAWRRDDIERLDHVRMLNAGRDPRLVDEHRDEVGVARELSVESLDGDGAREADRAEQAAEMDGRHAAGGERAVDRVSGPR